MQGVDSAEQAARGPEFLAKGRLSLRRVGKPTLHASFEWVRGYLAAGWTERLELRNEQGLRVFVAEQVNDETLVRSGKRLRKVGSLDEVMRSELGITVDTSTLAGWVSNLTENGELPDRHKWQGISIEVLTRGQRDRPVRMKLQQRDTVMVLAVTEFVE